MYNLSFFGQIFFCKHFFYKTGFCDKKFNFFKFLMMYHLSYLDIKHGIQRGGVKLTPPQRILVLKYPSGDRVNDLQKLYKSNLFESIQSRMRVQQQNHPHSAFYSEISLKFKGLLGSEAKTALQGPMKTWCCAPLVHRFCALFLRLLVPAPCSYHSKSFKGTIPDNLGESSKLLYSKNQDGLASLRSRV